MVHDRRAVVQRRVVRVIVEGDDGRLLLLQDSDVGPHGRRHWWIPPGGGVEEGESDEEAALRELGEETGLRLGRADLVGPVATRHVTHGYSEHVESQHEVYFVVTVPVFEPDTSGHTPKERLAIKAVDWTTKAAVRRGSLEVWPRNLLEILA